jgi:hypothetical protein
MERWCYIEDIVDAMDMANDMVIHYLDCHTGEVIPITEEALAAATQEGGAAELDGITEESLERIREIVNSGATDFVKLPTRYEVNEYKIIEQFVEGLGDYATFRELSRAIHGPGAFRRFKDVVRELGMEDAWFEYREVRFLAIAEAWCEKHDIKVLSRKPAGE